jgi:DNA-binding response OmpR family regulator
MRIAIADADPAAADLLVFVAQRRGHQPICVPAVERLFERLPFQPGAIVLALPELDDPAVASIATVRGRFADAYLLAITERPGATGTLHALKAGANDVMTSPYNPFEAMHRLESWAASRTSIAAPGDGVRLGDIEVDIEAHTASKNSVQLTLTKLERRLLYCMVEHHPGVATIDRLLAFGWDSPDDPDAGLLKTHISHIRRKLREAGGTPFEIVSHQTVGYSLRFAEPQSIAS